MRTAAAGSLLSRTGAATAACTGASEVAEAVFAAVAAEIPFVFACLATIDPATGLITGAFKSHPLEIGDEEFSAAEYGAPDVNRFAELAERRVPVGALSVDTGGHPERCRRFREFMAPRFGFTDELRLACRTHRTVWAALALYRGAGDAPFTAREARDLASVHETVAAAVRRALLAVPATAPPGSIGPALLIVDRHDRLTDTSMAAEQLIETLGGWDHGSLPATLLAATAAARSAGSAMTSTVRTVAGAWLAVRATPVSGLSGDRSVVLAMEPAAHAAVGQIELAARGLTPRETDIVERVLKGASTAAIAADLHLSAHTVQDHLKAVFAKLEVGSRRELVARFVD